MRVQSLRGRLLVLAAVAATLGIGLVPVAHGQQERRQVNPAFVSVEDDPDLSRVLLLGDSISIGYTIPVRKALAGKANVHRPKENCGPTIRGLESIDEWLGDGKWDVIHFNWGLHDLKMIDGRHQVPLPEYARNLTKLVERLKGTGAKLIWCSTTPVPEGVSPPRKDEDVVAYNAVAAKIMKANHIRTNDLYTFSLARLNEIQRKANVHFTSEGSKILAGQVTREILKTLEETRPFSKGPFREMIKKDEDQRKRFKQVQDGMEYSEVESIMGEKPDVTENNAWIYRLSLASNTSSGIDWRLVISFTDDVVSNTQISYTDIVVEPAPEFNRSR